MRPSNVCAIPIITTPPTRRPHPYKLTNFPPKKSLFSCLTHTIVLLPAPAVHHHCNPLIELIFFQQISNIAFFGPSIFVFAFLIIQKLNKFHSQKINQNHIHFSAQTQIELFQNKFFCYTTMVFEEDNMPTKSDNNVEKQFLETCMAKIEELSMRVRYMMGNQIKIKSNLIKNGKNAFSTVSC